jgi:hypothetical protein
MTTNPERILCCQANGQVKRTIQHKIPSGFHHVLDIRAINISVKRIKITQIKGLDGFESPSGTMNIVAAGFNPPKKYNV